MALEPVGVGAQVELAGLGEAELLAVVRGQPRPEHVAIIMDGNGRWATRRGRPGDARQRGPHPHDGLQLRRARRAHRRLPRPRAGGPGGGAPARGDRGEGDPACPVHRRRAGPRPPDSDERRNAGVEFPPVADRLHGAVDHADPLAGLRRRRPLPRDRRIPAADSPVRWGGTGAGMKRITLLGATGSIGLRTLDLVSSFSEEFEVAGLAARGSNVERIADLCRKYSPRAVALLDAGALDQLARLLPAPRPELLSGPDGLVALARDVDADVVVSALVGGAGLLPTMAAILAGRTVALANKETLVVAGGPATRPAPAPPGQPLALASEHSARFPGL